MDEKNLTNELLAPFFDTQHGFQKKQHLGIFGVFKLFEYVKDSKNFRLGVISEFGEELGSYRTKVAKVLNEELGLRKKGKRILTGDTNLRIQILEDLESCEQCNKNTSMRIKCTRFACTKAVCPLCINERCVKYLEKGVFYNCQKKECREEQYSPPGGFYGRERLRGF